jgi:hypothetical protein
LTRAPQFLRAGKGFKAPQFLRAGKGFKNDE